MEDKNQGRDTYGEKNILDYVLGYVFNITDRISSNISGNISSIENDAHRTIDRIDNRIKEVEKRVMRKTISVVLLLFGTILLFLALISFLREGLGLSNTVSFLSIGIVVLAIGIILNLKGGKMAKQNPDLRQRVHNRVDKIVDKAEDMNEKGKEAIFQLREKMMDMRDNLDGSIQRYPERSVLIAAGIGALIGSILVSSMMRRRY